MVNAAIGRALLVLVLVSGLIGCTPKHGGPAPGGLRIQLSAEPVSLDPALAEDGVSLKILANVMEGLVGYDGAGKLVNRLAQSYSILDGGKKYEFTLREGARWSDGKPVRAADFVAGLRRSLSPQTASKDVAVFASLIRGAEAYRAGKSADLPGVHEEAGKLVIELERPARFFVQALTLSQAAPIREDVLAAHGGRWVEDAPVTGPYRIVSHVPDQEIRLEKNPAYYEKAGGPDQVRLLIVADEATATALFDQGKVDILDHVSALDMKRLSDKGFIRTDPFVAVYYLAFNVKKPPFDDRDWRRAVAGAIRRDEIVTALGGGELPARSWIPRGIEGYIPYTDRRAGFRNSIDAVRARGAPAAPVSAGFDSSGRNSMIMEKVQQDVVQELRLKLSLENTDWKSYVKELQTDAPPIFRFGWLAPFLDPIMHMRVFVTGDPNNYSNFSNHEYDELVRSIETAFPGPGREAKLKRAQEIIVDDEAVVVPIFHYVQVHAVGARVGGFRVNPFGVVRFEELSVAES